MKTLQDAHAVSTLHNFLAPKTIDEEIKLSTISVCKQPHCSPRVVAQRLGHSITTLKSETKLTIPSARWLPTDLKSYSAALLPLAPWQDHRDAWLVGHAIRQGASMIWSSFGYHVDGSWTMKSVKESYCYAFVFDLVPLPEMNNGNMIISFLSQLSWRTMWVIPAHCQTYSRASTWKAHTCVSSHDHKWELPCMISGRLDEYYPVWHSRLPGTYSPERLGPLSLQPAPQHR